MITEPVLPSDLPPLDWNEELGPTPAPALESAQKPEIDEEEEYLKTLNDEQRLAYILSKSSQEGMQKTLRLIQNLMHSDADRVAFADKFNTAMLNQHFAKNLKPKQQDRINRVNTKINSELDPAQAPGMVAQQEQSAEQLARAQQYEEQGLKQRHKSAQQANQEKGQVQQQAARPTISIGLPSFSFSRKPKPEDKPDFGDSFATNVKSMINKSSNYKGPFAEFEHAFAEGNKKGWHDAESSVPFRGQVSPSGQLQFATEQGENLSKIMRSKGITPLSASPADREVLRRADAADHEKKMTALESSESAMGEWEQQLMKSISRFKKGSLLKAMPEIVEAQTAEEVKKLFDHAKSTGALNRNDVKKDLQSISNNLKFFGDAVENHAGCLVSAGMEDKASDLINQFQTKAEAMKSDGFLDEATNKAFSEQLEKLNEKLVKMISKMIDRIQSVFSGPKPTPV